MAHPPNPLPNIAASPVYRNYGSQIGERGLQRQLDAARQQASIWLGNQTAEHLDREPESERLLAEAGHNLIAGEKRIHQLKAHLDHLARVLELLTQK